jgi:hypothetical protein
MSLTTTRSAINGVSSGLASGSIPSALVIRDVPDFIQYMKRRDRPMLSLVPRKGSKNIRKWEWGEGDLSPRADALAEALDTTETGVDVVHGDYFQVNDLVRVNTTGENFLVTAFASANTLTVVRGWGSTSGTNAASGDGLTILGPASAENVDAVNSPITFGETFSTGAQIFEYSWPMSHRAINTPNYQNKSDQFKYELKKKMEESAIDLDLTLLNGVYNEGDGTPTNPATMGGLRDSTTTNVVDINAAPLELIDLMDELQTIYSDVGTDMGMTLMGNYFVKRVFNSWFQPARRSSGSDKKGTLVWDTIETEFGVLKFITNYNCDNNELFLCNEKDWGLYNMADGDWQSGEYATQGWYKRGFLHGDFGAIFEADRRRARWHNFSTTEDDYSFLDVAA